MKKRSLVFSYGLPFKYQRSPDKAYQRILAETMANYCHSEVLVLGWMGKWADSIWGIFLCAEIVLIMLGHGEQILPMFAQGLCNLLLLTDKLSGCVLVGCLIMLPIMLLQCNTIGCHQLVTGCGSTKMTLVVMAL